jgi:hypothetical protein
VVSYQSNFFPILFTARAVLHSDRENVITPIAIIIIYACVIPFFGDYIKQSCDRGQKQADDKYLQAFILPFNTYKGQEEGYDKVK